VCESTRLDLPVLLPTYQRLKRKVSLYPTPAHPWVCSCILWVARVWKWISLQLTCFGIRGWVETPLGANRRAGREGRGATSPGNDAAVEWIGESIIPGAEEAAVPPVGRARGTLTTVELWSSSGQAPHAPSRGYIGGGCRLTLHPPEAGGREVQGGAPFQARGGWREEGGQRHRQSERAVRRVGFAVDRGGGDQFVRLVDEGAP